MPEDGDLLTIGQGDDEVFCGVLSKLGLRRIDAGEDQLVVDGTVPIACRVVDGIRAIAEGVAIGFCEGRSDHRTGGLHVGYGFVADALCIEHCAIGELDQLHIEIAVGGEMPEDGDLLTIGQGDDEVLSGILSKLGLCCIDAGEDQLVVDSISPIASGIIDCV